MPSQTGLAPHSYLHCLMHTFYFGKVNIMPKNYSKETREKAVRLVRDHVDDYGSEWAAVKSVAKRLGMNPETLRKWIRQAEIDEGSADGVTTAAAQQVREFNARTPNWNAPRKS